MAPSRGPTGSLPLFLVYDREGHPLTQNMLRNRFEKARELAGLKEAQFRDLRGKAASDSEDLEQAQRLLGHTKASTTDRYIRARVGGVARPVNRKIGDRN